MNPVDHQRLHEILMGLIKQHRGKPNRISRESLRSQFVREAWLQGMMSLAEYQASFLDMSVRDRWDRKMRKTKEKLVGTPEGCFIFSTSGDGGGYWWGTREEVDDATRDDMAKALKMLENVREQRRLAKLPVPRPIQELLPLDLGAQEGMSA